MWLSALVFLLVGIGHLVRVIVGSSVTIGSMAIPMWVSWVALVIAFILSYFGFMLNSRA